VGATSSLSDGGEVYRTLSFLINLLFQKSVWVWY